MVKGAVISQSKMVEIHYFTILNLSLFSGGAMTQDLGVSILTLVLYNPFHKAMQAMYLSTRTIVVVMFSYCSAADLKLRL